MTAAEMGEAVMAICEATVAIASGRDGRILSLAISAITGRVEKAVSAGTGKDGHGVGYHRRQEGDVFGVAAQNFFRQERTI